MKRGMTLVEITVAMAIFVTITTLVVGGFVTITRMKALTSAMRESQQKIRIANEMVTRLSRQADSVLVDPTNKQLTLTFSSNSWKTVFRIAPGIDGKTTLFIKDNDSTEIDLLGGVTELDSNSLFKKQGGIPPVLEFVLSGKITGISNNPYYSNNFSLNNSVVLEGVK